VTSANAPAYLGLPYVAAVGGSWMVAPELVRNGDFEGVTRLSAEAVGIAAEVGL
jgi:2-dehydro-3-deoxyphosphogluconate aldolase/(4S)-4-hydroxy-2-oxoglutarate aldolase